MLTLKKSQLRAAIHCASKKDLRHPALVGVYIECTVAGDVHIVGCDGITLFAGLIPAANVKWTVAPKLEPWSIIIPLNTVKTALKADTATTLNLTDMSDEYGDRYLLGSTMFTPVGSAYPDWRRVAKLPDNAPEAGHYDPDLLAQAKEATREWFEGGKKWLGYLHQFGKSAGVYTGDDSTGFAIVMPLLSDVSNVRPFTPSDYK